MSTDEDYKNGLNPTGKIMNLPSTHLTLNNMVLDEHLNKLVGEVHVKGPFVFKK